MSQGKRLKSAYAEIDRDQFYGLTAAVKLTLSVTTPEFLGLNVTVSAQMDPAASAPLQPLVVAGTSV